MSGWTPTISAGWGYGSQRRFELQLHACGGHGAAYRELDSRADHCCVPGVAWFYRMYLKVYQDINIFNLGQKIRHLSQFNDIATH
jgi:hypothetical protein